MSKFDSDRGGSAKVPATPFEPLITAGEAGRLLSVHPVTLLKWAREGRVPHRRLGRRVAFRASELDLWVTSLGSGVKNAA